MRSVAERKSAVFGKRIPFSVADCFCVRDLCCGIFIATISNTNEVRQSFSKIAFPKGAWEAIGLLESYYWFTRAVQNYLDLNQYFCTSLGKFDRLIATNSQRQVQQRRYGKRYAAPEKAKRRAYFAEDSSESSICGKSVASRTRATDGLFLDASTLYVGDLDASY